MTLVEQEEWRPIPSCPGYEASSLGRIKSLPRKVAHRYGHRSVRERIIKPWTTAQGRHVFDYCRKNVFVAHAVCEAFHGPRPEGMEVCHNNGIRNDNRSSNLRYDTKIGNARDRISHGTNKFKLTEDQVIYIRSNPDISSADLARLFMVNKSTVSKARAGATWSHIVTPDQALGITVFGQWCASTDSTRGLAKRIGVNAEAVRYWRLGVRSPHPKHWRKIVALSGGAVTLDDLLDVAAASKDAA